MTAPTTTPDPRHPGEELDPDESPKERLDRELIELLNEVRVALPGAQVLFAFLLVLPFQARFEMLTDLQRDLYAGALMASAAAIALLIAPSSYHRLNFRRPMKGGMIRWANGLLIGGMALIALGVTLAVALVIDIALGDLPAVILAGATALWFLWFWFVVPLWRRRSFEEGD
ncbi:MAG: hypothetical protein KF809_11965 [Chloroflexi bacterium]|nr:hypothetical protein [Chloroflexota bacterium]